MRMEVLCFFLGTALCGATLTYTGLIRQPEFSKPEPAIRRNTLHLGARSVDSRSISAYPNVQTGQQTGFQNGRFYANTTPQTTGYAINVASPAAPQAGVSGRPPQSLRTEPRPQAAPKEYTLRLDEPQWFFAAGRKIRVQLHDYGSETIGVQIDNCQPRPAEKA